MKAKLTRELIALRISKELKDGMYVNLGMGIPVLLSNFIPNDIEVVLHSENGILGYGAIATEEEMDIDLINASSMPVTLIPGACFVDHATSFAIIRGGHLDLCILGALQVSESGDLASWTTSVEAKIGTIGGAIDLAAGAKRLLVAMEHTTPSGKPKILKKCTFSLTGSRVVDTIFTDLAVIRVDKEGLVLEELAPGFTPEEVQDLTEPKLIVSPKLKEILL